MYNWLNGFYRVMNGKYSITLIKGHLAKDVTRASKKLAKIGTEGA